MAVGRWITELTPQTSIVDAGRRVLSLRLEAVRDCLGLALREADHDHEHIHQLRVSTRRAGAALQIFDQALPDKTKKSLKKHLRKLRRTAGAVRDVDVFLLRIQSERSSQKRTWRPALDFLHGHALAERDRALAGLRAACPNYPFPIERLMTESLAQLRESAKSQLSLMNLGQPLLAGLINSLRQQVSIDSESFETLHQVRILGKRLRYAMEIFVDCYSPPFKDLLYAQIERMQEILGKANDAQVSCGKLKCLRERVRLLLPQEWKRLKPGFEALIADDEARMDQQRVSFWTWWESWKALEAENPLRALALPISSPPQFDGNPGAGWRPSGPAWGNPAGDG